MTQLVGPVARLLAESSSHEMVGDVLARVEDHEGVRAEAWIADYRQHLLRALRSGDTVPVDDSWVGRCFASQTVLREDGRTAFPLTTRGDRVGVLEVGSEDLDREDLSLLASLVAQALSAIGSTTTVYESQRRVRPLTVAAELQWALLPGQSYRDADVTVGGLLEPAYSIAGDAYDWSRDDTHVSLAVLDGTGRGVPAALATTLALGALRNARFTGRSLADQAALADQAVYSQYGGEVFTSALLLQFDVDAGRMAVVDAGSPLLFRQREGRVDKVELEAQLPLGMFEETLYLEQEVDVRPGDRLLVVSDGVHGVVDGAEYGGKSFETALRDGRLLSPAEVCRHVVRSLRSTWGDDGPEDDAVVVCLDWHPKA